MIVTYIIVAIQLNDVFRVTTQASTLKYCETIESIVFSITVLTVSPKVDCRKVKKIRLLNCPIVYRTEPLDLKSAHIQSIELS